MTDLDRTKENKFSEDLPLLQVAQPWTLFRIEPNQCKKGRAEFLGMVRSALASLHYYAFVFSPV